MFRSIDSTSATGLNETSFGGYVGGFAYNPECYNCTPYNASDPNSILFGYETVAYLGAHNHMTVNPNKA